LRKYDAAQRFRVDREAGYSSGLTWALSMDKEALLQTRLCWRGLVIVSILSAAI
jgi:hypothetical protein